MKNKSVKITLRVTLIVIFMASLLYGVVYVVNQQSSSSIKSMVVEPFLTKKVKESEPTIEKYAKEHGVKNHDVKYFAESLEAANGDVRLAVQSSNFGKGFSNYVREQETTFSQEITIEFSQDMYAKAEDKSAYTCLREEAKEFDACYGDIYYSRDVMRYKELFAKN